jgi:hypothetical protein
MSPMCIDPDTLLTRDRTAAALKEAGFPTETKTLATVASRGGGPRYSLYGRRALYRWGDALTWARGRLGPPRHTTSEADATSCARRQHKERRLLASAQSANNQLPSSNDGNELSVVTVEK